MKTVLPERRPRGGAVVPTDPQGLVQQNAHLREALDSRTVIGQATGLLMALHRCSANQAFALLVRVSQTWNHKLREVAEQYLRVAGDRVPSCGGNPRRPSECDPRCWGANDTEARVQCLHLSPNPSRT